MNHLGDTNKMVETPRTDAVWELFAIHTKLEPDVEFSTLARILERELNTANDRIKRLEEAGDRMRLFCADPDDCFAWDKAKEAKL
jgi:hypothetical protein